MKKFDNHVNQILKKPDNANFGYTYNANQKLPVLSQPVVSIYNKLHTIMLHTISMLQFGLFNLNRPVLRVFTLLRKIYGLNSLSLLDTIFLYDSV